MKKQFSILKIIGLFILQIITVSVYAADYYWVGGSGNWSEYANHWATTSGGTTFHTQAPTKNDDVFFDENSFLAAGSVVTIDEEAYCKNMDWTGANYNPHLSFNTGIDIHSSLILHLSMTVFTNGGPINFLSSETGNLINTYGIDLNDLRINFIGSGEWTLINDLNMPNGFIRLDKGTFNTNGNTITVRSFISKPDFPNNRTLRLSNSVINVESWAFTPLNLNFDAGTSTLNLNTDDEFNPANLDYYNVNIFPPLPSFFIQGSGTYHHVVMHNTGGVQNVVFDKNSVNAFDSLVLPSGGDCLNYLNLNSDGTESATLSIPSGTFNAEFLKIKNIHVTGGADFNANNCIDLGGNMGWNFLSTYSGPYYWIGDSGNWSDPDHWATSSEGTPNGCIPSLLNDVFFDDNSFSAPGQTVTINIPAQCNSMDWSTISNNPTLVGSNPLELEGSLTLSLFMIVNFTDRFNFISDNPGNTIDLAGNQLTSTSFSFTGKGEWTLSDAININHLRLHQGILNSDNHKINLAGDFISSFNDTAVFNLGNSKINCGRYWYVFNPNLTINSGSSVINIGGREFRGGGENYNVVHLNSNHKTVKVHGNNTFDTLTIPNAFDRILFQKGSNQTMNYFEVADGNCTNFISLRTTSLTGEQANLTLKGDTFNGNYLQVEGMGVSGGTYKAINSLNIGNNTGWDFTEPDPRTLYWIGGTGNWNDTAHWSLSSGGTPAGGCIPTKVDTVIFDGQSFNSIGQLVTINTEVFCSEMIWSGVTDTPEFTGSSRLNIYGSLTLDSNMTFSYGGSIYFRSDNPGNSIDMNGHPFNNHILFAGNGSYQLNSHIDIPSNALYLENGSLITNGNNINCSSFSSSTSNIRVLDLGSSVITCSFQWSIVDGANFTINPGASVINVASDPFLGGGLTYHDVNLNFAGILDIKGSNTFNSLDISSATIINFEGGTTQTINNNISLPNGTCQNLVEIQSDFPANPVTLNITSGTFNFEYLFISDVKKTGAGALIANNSTGVGDKSGWVINSPASQDFYWIGGVGNWNAAVHWSNSTGGPVSGCLPNINDNVFFDDNSFTNSNQFVNINVPAYCNNMDWTGVTNRPIMNGSKLLTINGSLTLDSNMRAINPFGGIQFTSDDMGNTITTNGVSLNAPVTFNGEGEWNLMDNLSSNDWLNPDNLTLQKGTLNTNNHDISFPFSDFQSLSSATRGLNLGNSEVILKNWIIEDSTNLSFDAANSTIILDDGDAFNGGGQSYNVVKLYDFSGFVDNSNTFDTLSIFSNPGSFVGFEEGSVQQINYFEAQGSGIGSEIIMKSTIEGQQSNLQIANYFCGNYLAIEDIAISGDTAYAGENSIDNGNNTGWNFTACGVAPVLLANFTANKNPLCGNENVTFTDQSTGNINSYEWDFGDGANPATGIGAGPHTINYTSSGQKTIKLKITDPSADSDSLSITITVTTASNAGTNNTLNVCPGETSLNLFDGIGAIYDNGGTWLDDDGTGALTDSIFNPSMVVTDSVYHFTYLVTGTGPCENDSATVTVNVSSSVNAGTGGTIDACTNESVNLSDGLTGNPDAGGTWFNETDNIVAGGIFNSVDIGIFNFKYKVTAIGGCAGDFTTVTVAVTEGPYAGEDGTSTTCSNAGTINLFTHLGGAYNSGGTWLDDDGTGALTDSIFDPSMVAIDSAYHFTYVVTGTGLCEHDSATVMVNVSSSLNAGTGGTINACTNESVNLSDGLTGNPDAGGTWFNETDNIVAGGIFNSVDIGIFNFKYKVTAIGGCAGDFTTVTVAVTEGPYAGEDGTSTTCSNAGTINLFTHLGGAYNSGGTWLDDDGTGALTDSIFDPSAQLQGTYQFTYLTTNGNGQCENDSATVSININVCTGIEESMNSSFTATIYPVPVREYFTLKIESNRELNGFNVQMMNMLGKVVYEEDVENKSSVYQKQFNLNEIPKMGKGIYFLRIRSVENNETIIKKLIVE